MKPSLWGACQDIVSLQQTEQDDPPDLILLAGTKKLPQKIHPQNNRKPWLLTKTCSSALVSWICLPFTLRPSNTNLKFSSLLTPVQWSGVGAKKKAISTKHEIQFLLGEIENQEKENEQTNNKKKRKECWKNRLRRQALIILGPATAGGISEGPVNQAQGKIPSTPCPLDHPEPHLLQFQRSLLQMQLFFTTLL